MKRGTSIGVDVGGTRIRVAVVDACGRIVFQSASPTSDVCKGRDPLAGIIQQIKVAESERECGGVIEAIGLALPATLDGQRYSVVRCVSFPELQGRSPAAEVTRQTGIPCFLLTDIEAATWAEYLHGEPVREGWNGPPYLGEPKSGRFIHVRVGTGVGVGAVFDGQIHRLDEGRTTHLPALVVDDDPNACRCPCGLTGCLERYCSGVALTEAIEAQGIGQQVADLQAAWERGEDTARALLASSADALTGALRNLTTLFSPTVFNLGGGVITGLPALLEQVRLRFRAVNEDAHVSCCVVKAHPFPDRTKDVAAPVSARPSELKPAALLVESAGLGDAAGVIGAALMANSMAASVQGGQGPPVSRQVARHAAPVARSGGGG